MCFAQVSKSAGYCFVNRDKPVGCLLLCETALGSSQELLHADFNASSLPPGKLSTKGVGVTTPDSAHFVTLPDGCVVPCGPPVEVKTSERPSLLYSEYIGRAHAHSTRDTTREPAHTRPPVAYTAVHVPLIRCTDVCSIALCVCSVRRGAGAVEVPREDAIQVLRTASEAERLSSGLIECMKLALLRAEAIGAIQALLSVTARPSPFVRYALLLIAGRGVDRASSWSLLCRAHSPCSLS